MKVIVCGTTSSYKHMTVFYLHAVNLYDVNSKLLDNLTVTFETMDTCFCYGFCGCAVSIVEVKKPVWRGIAVAETNHLWLGHKKVVLQ